MFLKNLNSRRFKMGGLATAIIVIAVAAVIVLNIIVALLADRFPLSVDLTANKAYELGGQSIDYVKGLDADVKIYVLSDEDDFSGRNMYYAQINELVKKYDMYSDRISVEYIDYVKNPTFLAQYPDYDLSQMDIIVESGDKVKVVSPGEMFLYDYNAYGQPTGVRASMAEQFLTSAIVNVTTEDKVIVSILTGHNDFYPEPLVKLLELANYEVITQNLALEDINPDATFAVLAAPAKDLSEGALAKLDKFLENGGNFGKTFFYFAATGQDELPNLDTFLAEWGVAVGPGAVFETNKNKIYDYNNYFAAVDYVDEEYSSLIRDTRSVAVVAFARPLEVLYDYSENYSTRVLLQFGDTSVVRPPDAGSDFNPDTAEKKGPIPTLVMSTKSVHNPTANKYLSSNIIVSGSTVVLDDVILDNTSFTNHDYFLSIFNKISEREDVIVVPPKTLVGRALNLNANLAIALGRIFNIILPVGTLLAGVAIWLFRRHK